MAEERAITITVTEEQLKIIRTALCDKSLKTLCQAQSIQREAKQNGYEDSISHLWYEKRDKIREIIHFIDEINENQ